MLRPYFQSVIALNGCVSSPDRFNGLFLEPSVTHPAGAFILCLRDLRVHSEVIVISNQGCCAGLTSDKFDYQIIKRQEEVIAVLEYVTLCVLLRTQWSPYELLLHFLRVQCCVDKVQTIILQLHMFLCHHSISPLHTPYRYLYMLFCEMVKKLKLKLKLFNLVESCTFINHYL